MVCHILLVSNIPLCPLFLSSSFIALLAALWISQACLIFEHSFRVSYLCSSQNSLFLNLEKHTNLMINS